MNSNPRNYVDYGGADDRADFVWLAGHRSACECRLSLRPIGPTPALSVSWPAPLKQQYSAWGAIQVLYAFALAFRKVTIGLAIYWPCRLLRLRLRLAPTPMCPVAHFTNTFTVWPQSICLNCAFQWKAGQTRPLVAINLWCSASNC